MTTIVISIVTALAGLFGAPVSSSSGPVGDMYVDATYVYSSDDAEETEQDYPEDSGIWYYCP